MGKFICIRGIGGVGKTTLATQLGYHLADHGLQVILVFGNGDLPPKEYLFDREGQKKEDASLGALLTHYELTSDQLYTGISMLNDNFGIVGYNMGECLSDFPAITAFGKKRFLQCISNMADIVIFDDFHEFFDYSVNIVNVLDASAKSASWLRRYGSKYDINVMKLPYTDSLSVDVYLPVVDVPERISILQNRRYSASIKKLADILLHTKK